jgi:uncharacterized protein (UPF0548 family)
VNVRLLEPEQTAGLRGQELTYSEVGRTAGSPPPGYHYLRRTRLLPSGTDFDSAARAVLSWQVQLRAGLKVRASSLEVEHNAVAVMQLGIGPLAVDIPCRVVYVVNEPDRRGFAYGTLPGHPESGEEAFVLQRRQDERIEFAVTAFSKPSTTLAKLSGPVGRRFQRHMTTRYLRALTR